MADKVFIIVNGEFLVTKNSEKEKEEQSENIQEILENPKKACKL